MWTRIFFVLLAAFIAWLIYQNIKHNPQAFSKENLGKSFYVLGLLALALIVFVGLLILLVRG